MTKAKIVATSKPSRSAEDGTTLIGYVSCQKEEDSGPQSRVCRAVAGRW
jgi:hypothetical protein